jgi:hypothetical protein
MGEREGSYGQIFHPASIVGRAQIINNVILLLRVKAFALIVGPLGGGLFGITMSATAIVAIVTDYEPAHAQLGSRYRVGEWRGGCERGRVHLPHSAAVCWVTGLLGWAATILLRNENGVFVAGSRIDDGG